MKACQYGHLRTKRISIECGPHTQALLHGLGGAQAVPEPGGSEPVHPGHTAGDRQLRHAAVLSTNTKLCRKKSAQCQGMRKAAQRDQISSSVNLI
jgi:hypothetical protein